MKLYLLTLLDKRGKAAIMQEVLLAQSEEAARGAFNQFWRPPNPKRVECCEATTITSQLKGVALVAERERIRQAQATIVAINELEEVS